MMADFARDRSDAIRAGLIDRVATQTHEARRVSPGAGNAPTTRASTPPRQRRRRAPWLAASVSLVLIGAVVGVAFAARISAPQVASTPSASNPSTSGFAAEYVGVGPVIERDGVIQLCVGGEFQSRPPGCIIGVVLHGWDWSTSPVTSQEVGGVRFTESSVTVTGVIGAISAAHAPALTLTRPPVAGRPASGSPGPATSSAPSGLSEAELTNIMQTSLDNTIGPATSSITGGVIDATVAVDDGSLQRAADERYGPGVVRVSSLLTPAP